MKYLTLPVLRLLTSKGRGRKHFWKPSKPCHIGIHWVPLAEYSQVSTMLLVANLANTKWCNKNLKNDWNPGTLVYLRVLRESYPMNTNMTGSRWFSKNLYVLVLWMKVASALERLNSFQEIVLRVFDIFEYLWNEKTSINKVWYNKTKFCIYHNHEKNIYICMECHQLCWIHQSIM